MFLDDKYLKYVGWTMYDRVSNQEDYTMILCLQNHGATDVTLLLAIYNELKLQDKLCFCCRLEMFDSGV